MAEKKTRGSEKVKEAYASFSKLSELEKDLFFNKYFAVLLRGLNVSDKKNVKKDWKTLFDKIETLKRNQCIMDSLDTLPLPILKDAVARREKAQADGKKVAVQAN